MQTSVTNSFKQNYLAKKGSRILVLDACKLPFKKHSKPTVDRYLFAYNLNSRFNSNNKYKLPKFLSLIEVEHFQIFTGKYLSENFFLM